MEAFVAGEWILGSLIGVGLVVYLVSFVAGFRSAWPMYHWTDHGTNIGSGMVFAFGGMLLLLLLLHAVP